MAMRGPLKRELKKYRKVRAGAMPGLPGRRHYVTGAVPAPVHGDYSADLYMWGVPRSYHPNINAPAAQSDEYVTDPDWESHQAPPSHHERLLRPFPEFVPDEPDFDYDIAKAHDAFFLKAVEIRYQSLAEGQEVPTLADVWYEHMMEEAEPRATMHDQFDSLVGLEVPPEQPQRDLPELWDIAGALEHLQNVLPEDHPDIVNLRAAAHEILEHPERLPQPEDFGVEFTESKLGSGNPYEMDLIGGPEMPDMAHPAEGLFDQHEAAFEQQLQTLDDVLETPVLGPDEGPSMAPDEYAGLEAVLGAPDAGFVEADGLEQMIGQEDPFDAPPAEIMEPEMMPEPVGPDIGACDMGETVRFETMTPEDEINQVIDAVVAQPLQEMEPEPDPFDMQQDPFATAQQIFEEQMQHMHNPFMMPGMGPMGPMPGPAPGM